MEWSNISIIHNKPIIKCKKKKKVLTEEEIGNADFDIFAPIDEEFSMLENMKIVN